MTPSEVWVVSGETGEYSDRQEWTVCAYLSEADAQKHADLANAEAYVLESKRNGRYSDAGPNKYDPFMSMDYTGTKYRIEMVEIKPNPPE